MTTQTFAAAWPEGPITPDPVEVAIEAREARDAAVEAVAEARAEGGDVAAASAALRDAEAAWQEALAGLPDDDPAVIAAEASASVAAARAQVPWDDALVHVDPGDTVIELDADGVPYVSTAGR